MTKRSNFLFWLAGTILFFISVYVLKGVLLPFVAGMVLAYFLDPIADKLEATGLSRTLATVVITGAFLFFAILALLLFVPVLQGQIFTFVERLPAYIEAIWLKVEPFVDDFIQKLPEDKISEIEIAVANYTGDAINWVIKVLGGIVSKGMAFLSLLSLVVISPIVSFYMLRDWDKMVSKIDNLIPRPHIKVIREQFSQINSILAGFIRGQLTVCLFLGLFYGISLTLAGIDVGLIVGFVSGFISFIPYVGCIIGFVLSMGLAFAQSSDPTTLGVVAGIYVLGQFIEGNFLTPRLVGKSVGLHPVWVIFALLAGGSLFGFLGVLIAIPVAAVIGVLVRFSLNVYQKSTLYNGHKPYKGNRRNQWNKNYNKNYNKNTKSDRNNSQKQKQYNARRKRYDTSVSSKEEIIDI